MSQNSEQWPKTLQQAVNRLLKSLSPADRQALRGTPEDDLAVWHHGLGTAIRNEYGLRAGNSSLMRSCGVDRPDDASSIIIRTAWWRLNKDQKKSKGSTRGKREHLTLMESMKLIQEILDEAQEDD